MFDIPSFRIGRLFGIPVEINLSWLIIFGLVTVSLSTSYFPSVPAARNASPLLLWAVGAVTTLAFFISILLHELSHSLVARAEGGHVEKITLFIFGGVAQIEEEPRTPGREFLMAAAGPGMSLALGLVCLLGYTAAFSRGGPWWIWAPLEYLAVINFFVAIFNLLPGFPLDGGRVLRSILWAITKDLLKATRWAARSGQAIGWLMVGWAVLGVLRGEANLIWFGLVGWFIANLAGAAYRQQVMRSRVEGVTVGGAMTPSPEYVQGSLTLEDLAHHHFLGGPHSRYPVMHDGTIVGLVSLPEIKQVARPDWPFVHVIDVTNRDLEHLVIGQEAPVEEAIARFGAGPGALLVVGDGRLVGILTREDVVRLISAPDAA